MALIDCPSDLSENDRVKRILQGIVFILVIVSFTLASPRVYAAASTYYQTGYGSGVTNAIQQNTMSAAPYTGTQTYYSVQAMNCAMFPVAGENNCGTDATVLQGMYNKSALGAIAMGIDTMYTYPPADIAYWIRDTGTTLGFIPRQVYAQQAGIGFRGLEPLLPVWKAFRNIAYLLLALAMIVVGFLVMMRKQIDPKTVVTVQNSLPRIVIALILITFSYAIVGLMIDIMYLVMAFLSVVVQGAMPGGNPAGINYANPGIWDFTNSVFGPAINLNPLANLGNSKDIGQFAKNLIGGALFTITGVGFLFQFIVLLAFLFAYIRLLFLLLNCYIQILLGVLTGPLQILMDVFPGANGFTTWMKNIFSNLAVFPVTGFMLMLGNAIGQNLNTNTKALWTPPFLPQYIGSLQLPLLGDVSLGGMGGLAEMLITLGIVLAIPNIANGLKESLKAKSPIEAGPGVIFGPLGKATGSGMQAAFQISMIAQGAKGIMGAFSSGKEQHGGS
jgi:hypothetical protein